MRKCEVKGCSNEAIVGWGKNSKWICLDHFNQALGNVRKVVSVLEGNK
jgi:hypothetical protein